MAQTSRKSSPARKSEDPLSLKRLFPKHSYFGKAARGMKFSHDGKWAAWLWRGYDERRHGNDLFIYDVAKETVKRITSVVVMAPFQKATREVMKDRIKKAKARLEKKAKADKGQSKRKLDEKRLGDVVDRNDHKKKKAPRYGGVSSLVWSPTKNELLFTSLGDIYQYEAGVKDLKRLSISKESERDVQFLPDGSGYTYRRGSALLRVRFGSHLIEQINPVVPKGESMTGYKLSPDGKKLVFLTSKGVSRGGTGRKVSIASYKERFMKVREVSRHMSDDKLGKRESRIYLHEIPASMRENGGPVEVYRRDVTGPRDILRVPDWSPDSKQVAFSVFEQKSSQMTILLAKLPEPKKEKEKLELEKKKSEDSDSDDDDSDDDDSEDGGDDAKTQSKKSKKVDDKAPRKHPARVVYRFLHDGGPNTPRMTKPLFLADSKRVLFLSEQSGFRHLHVLDPLYESLDQLTRGHFEVYPIEMSKDKKTIYVTATKEAPNRVDIYRISLDQKNQFGDMKRVSKLAGRHGSVAISHDGSHLLSIFERYGALRELVHLNVRSGRQRALTNSHSQTASEVTKARPKFFQYNNRHGHKIHGYLWKPDHWSAKDKRPLLIYVYGGPLGTRKNVVEGSYSSDGYFFAQYLAKKHGWVCCTIDPRGMSGYGALYEKANFDQVGRPQADDLEDGVKFLVAQHGVDPEKVAIHGWSFGGFQTQMCMYTKPDVFKVGIAGAGPTEWENYNSWYSTGTIGNSRIGKTDLAKFSLLPLAKNLKGKLLLVHGMEDSNVLYQDTVKVYQALLKAGKETLVELFLDPTGGHGLGGDIKRYARMHKYEEFLLRTLGKGKPLGLNGRISEAAAKGNKIVRQTRKLEDK